MPLPLITPYVPDQSEWSLALETERALGYGRPLDSESTLDEERALDGERRLDEPADLAQAGDLRHLSLVPTPRPEVAERDVSNATADKWLLTTEHPHACARCGRHVRSGFMEIRVDRKVWVFCDKLCRLRWDSEHTSSSLVRRAEPNRSQP